MSLGAVSCGDDGEPPRAGEIRSMIEELWEAVGVDLHDTTWSRYSYQTRRDSVACADLPEDDRWFAAQASDVAGEFHPQDRIWEGVSAHLDEGGFSIDRYRFPGSGRLSLRAERDELVVFVDVENNGFTHIDVRAGPCAPFMGEEPPTASEPIP